MKLITILLFIPCVLGTTVPTVFQAGFNLQNRYRQKHQVANLTWNTTLSTLAQKWANNLIQTGTFQHGMLTDSKGNRIGQNLAQMGMPKNVNNSYNVQFSVKMWYDEVKNYNYSNPTFSGNTGHFTQVVWKGTRSVGFGMASKGTTTVVVANYYPPGNYMGQFKQNVLPPKN